jgi:integral membrane protein (TIGR01906 family)
VSAAERPADVAMNDPARPIVRLAAAVSTVIVLLGLAVLPFLTPAWILPTQARAEADAWTGWPIETVHEVTGAVLVDLVVGPPDFDQTVDGAPVFNERERGHLRDVRTLLIAFAVLVAIGAAILVSAWWLGRGGTAAWRGMRTAAKVLAVAVVALGVLAVVAFDTLFELFHVLLFPEGSYTFDPASERLVQLFPYAFWYQTAVAIGVLVVLLAVGTIALASWRIRRLTSAAAAGVELASGPAAT